MGGMDSNVQPTSRMTQNEFLFSAFHRKMTGATVYPSPLSFSLPRSPAALHAVPSPMPLAPPVPAYSPEWMPPAACSPAGDGSRYALKSWYPHGPADPPPPVCWYCSAAGRWRRNAAECADDTHAENRFSRRACEAAG